MCQSETRAVKLDFVKAQVKIEGYFNYVSWLEERRSVRKSDCGFVTVVVVKKNCCKHSMAEPSRNKTIWWQYDDMFMPVAIQNRMPTSCQSSVTSLMSCFEFKTSSHFESLAQSFQPIQLILLSLSHTLSLSGAVTSGNSNVQCCRYL
jgi:hypothetical protein